MITISKKLLQKSGKRKKLKIEEEQPNMTKKKKES